MFATRALLTLTACVALAGAAQPESVRILFVGNSFTHGRYLPVRTYRSGFGPEADAEQLGLTPTVAAALQQVAATDGARDE